MSALTPYNFANQWYFKSTEIAGFGTATELHHTRSIALVLIHFGEKIQCSTVLTKKLSLCTLSSSQANGLFSREKNVKSLKQLNVAFCKFDLIEYEDNKPIEKNMA
jgi:hypothetical protein